MLTPKEIARMIDHSILHPTFTDADLREQCAIAVQNGAATVCVKPYHVAQATECVAGSETAVCAVIGFPHGNSTPEIKLAETLQVIRDGATEVDMVINIGKMLQGDLHYVEEEIGLICRACHEQGILLKVIFETDFVTRTADRIFLCEACNRQSVDFAKTSTGYGFVKLADGNYNYQGATEEVLQLMRKHCAPEVAIKAAGGIRTLEQILKVRELGVTRVGATATTVIMQEARRLFGA
ncbi:MAG: deoxyribose-phosphate aldolase [Marinilabiliales bacterium]|nr:deoxyribose-phosphate aldolase [Marinilabiliales bacterium]